MTVRGYIASLFVAVSLLSCDEQDHAPAPEPGLGEEYSGGEFFTTFDASENAFGEQGVGLTTDQQTDFVVGNSIFRTNWVTAPASVQSLDGLGPMMNAISCGSCHFKDGRARPPITETEKLNGLLFRLSVPGTNAHGQSVDDPVYGGQFQDKAIEGVLNEGDVKITYEEITGSYDDGATWSLRKPTYTFTNLNFGSLDAQVLVSPRIAQQIPGLGLLENISEEDILSHADEYDADGDGISGKPNYVWDEKQQQKVLGRFGWKANQPSIAQQTAGAFNGDMGITSTLFPVDGLSQSQRTEYSQVPNGGEPEIEDESFQRVVNYIKTLSVPGRRDWKNGDVIEGKAIFTTLHCDGCHFPTTTTSSKSAISLLNNQTIHPYTDLLLHDMGEGLADNRPDFDASGTEWRTAPLWGIGLIKVVNRHTFLLHDGRARNIEEAILWHGGEADKSQKAFIALSAADRAKLIKFIESL